MTGYEEPAPDEIALERAWEEARERQEATNERIPNEPTPTWMKVAFVALFVLPLLMGYCDGGDPSVAPGFHR